MLVDRDIMKVMRYGKRLDSLRYRKQQESGIILAVCLGLASLILMIALVSGCEGNLPDFARERPSLSMVSRGRP